MDGGDRKSEPNGARDAAGRTDVPGTVAVHRDPDPEPVTGPVLPSAVTESAVIAAMEWTAGTDHARVVNMSLSFPNTAGSDPLETALPRPPSAAGRPAGS
jgi:hypothetical protein